MIIYFLRHGIAEDAQTWDGSDASRPLTGEGCERMEREAKTLAKLGFDLDALVSSPLVRAKQTADIVAGRLGMKKKLFVDERLAGNFDTGHLAALLEDRAGAENVMLVGHEPDFSATVGELIGGAAIDLKKGGLACVQIADRSVMQGRLVWLIPPKILAL